MERKKTTTVRVPTIIVQSKLINHSATIDPKIQYQNPLLKLLLIMSNWRYHFSHFAVTTGNINYERKYIGRQQNAIHNDYMKL